MKTVAVVAQVVAVKQGDIAAVTRYPACQNMADSAINRAASAINIGLYIRVQPVKVELVIEVITAFGHGKGDHFSVCMRSLLCQRRQLVIPGDDFLNRRNGFVFTFALRRDGHDGKSRYRCASRYLALKWLSHS